VDAKEISAFLTPPRLRASEILLVFTGAAIALLLVSAGTSLYRREYRQGGWCFVVALVLSFVFFRKRKVVLVISSVGCIFVLSSAGLPFHPSFGGWVLWLGSAAVLYWTIRRHSEKFPYLAYIHMHAVFKGEEAMAAENARIEAEARELVRKRPFGPWLFR
jgi:hypothetical protein